MYIDVCMDMWVDMASKLRTTTDRTVGMHIDVCINTGIGICPTSCNERIDSNPCARVQRMACPSPGSFYQGL